MSIKYMDRVWENKELKHGRLILMLALADHANDAGECWPSQRHLEEKTRLTERQLRRLIDGLVADGYVVVMEGGKGRGKKTHYRIFPQAVKADILSETKADILSQEKRTFLTPKSGQNVQVKADILAAKADIFDANQSHARSESPIEPSTEEPPMESSSSEDEEGDTPTASAIDEAWERRYGQMMPESVLPVMNKLIAECGEAAVLHGIHSAADNGARTVGYIAKCARNYVPPATNGSGKSYAVDLPGVHAMPPAPQAAPLPALPPPMPTADPWAVCLGELRASLPGGLFAMLTGSTCETAGSVPDGNGHPVPLYRIAIVNEYAAHGLTHFIVQAGPAIRRKVSSILGKPVQIEIVPATITELEPTYA